MANHELEANLHKVLQRTLEQTLKSCAPDTPWQIVRANTLEEIRHEHCIVLTIAAFKFRILCLLHLSLDATSRAFVANATATQPEALDESSYLDYLLEMSNSLCGNLKRNLQSSCPPLGMSTPNLLERSSLRFEDSATISHGVHACAMPTPGAPSFLAASLLLSLKDARDFNLLPFHEMASEIAASDDSAGELEMF
ncbi:MAG: hypothetical protein V4812_02765 [Pseudomonadota bacterium]